MKKLIFLLVMIAIQINYTIAQSPISESDIIGDWRICGIFNKDSVQPIDTEYVCNNDYRIIYYADHSFEMRFVEICNGIPHQAVGRWELNNGELFMVILFSECYEHYRLDTRTYPNLSKLNDRLLISVDSYYPDKPYYVYFQKFE